MNGLQMSMNFNLADMSNAAVTFIVAYGPTDTAPDTREHKDVVWKGFSSPVSRVSSSDYLFFLIHTNARTSVQIGAYGRNTRVSDSNGTLFLRFAGDNKLALVNTISSVSKG